MWTYLPARSISRSSTSASEAPGFREGRTVRLPQRATGQTYNLLMFRYFCRGRLSRPFFIVTLHPMKMRPGLRRCCAAFLLSVLLAAYAGQKVHIYNEDPAHFAAFSGDLVPDNGAEQQIVEFCIVDDSISSPICSKSLTRTSSTPRCSPCCCLRPRAASVRLRFRSSPCGRLLRRNLVSPPF